MMLEPILEDCGLVATRCERVHGGDINEAWHIYTSNGNFFLKRNNARRYPNMFEKEADGLNALSGTIKTIPSAILKIPCVVKTGIVQEWQYILLEWIDRGTPTARYWETFGNNLALLHKIGQPHYGWSQDNYIGSLPQLNSKSSSWQEFYAESRLIPLAKKLFDSGSFVRQDINYVDSLCSKLINHFPASHPSLLHGDLWSGNFLIAENGVASIYDPAVYFGHREMDIGMTKLFGGFDERFYMGYNEAFPLEHGWQQRLPVTQLYPLLVHAVLFGGHYVSKARDIIKAFR